MHFLPIFPVILLQVLSLLTTATCYFPSGAVDISSDPCPGVLDTPMCCWLNRTDGNSPDICTQQGLCISNDVKYEGKLFVDGCSNSSWSAQGSGCSPMPGLCGTQGDQYTPLTQCNDGSFCCGHNNSTCCGAGTGIFLTADGKAVLFQTNSTSSRGFKIGLGVSVGILAIGVIGLAVIAFSQSKRIRVLQAEMATRAESTYLGGGDMKDMYQLSTLPPVEAEARQPIQELEGGSIRNLETEMASAD